MPAKRVFKIPDVCDLLRPVNLGEAQFLFTPGKAGTVYTGADFGSRFKMSGHRFQDILKIFSFASPCNGVNTSDVIQQCMLTWLMNNVF